MNTLGGLGIRWSADWDRDGITMILRFTGGGSYGIRRCAFDSTLLTIERNGDQISVPMSQASTLAKHPADPALAADLRTGLIE